MGIGPRVRIVYGDIPSRVVQGIAIHDTDLGHSTTRRRRRRRTRTQYGNSNQTQYGNPNHADGGHTGQVCSLRITARVLSS